jgi:tetratricopeptide (TPR) repeat protein
MASQVPTVRQTALISIIPQFSVLGGLILMFYFLKTPDYFVYGAISYLFLSFSLRNILTRHHKAGIRLIRKKDYKTAIYAFQRSYDFFTRNNWIDKFRYLTVLSSSAMCYREMALCNIAFSYSQIGDGKKAKEYYEKTLRDYPNNGLAIAAMNMIKSAENRIN